MYNMNHTTTTTTKINNNNKHNNNNTNTTTTTNNNNNHNPNTHAGRAIRYDPSGCSGDNMHNPKSFIADNNY